MSKEQYQSIAALYRAEYKKLFTVAYRLVKTTEAAEDLVHDVFCLATIHQETVMNHPNQEGWLMCTLKKLASNELRRAENRLTVPLENALLYRAAGQKQKVGDLLPSALSQSDKQILTWRIEQQLSYKEIAQILGISEAGCRSRVARAIAKCRKLMDPSDLN